MFILSAVMGKAVFGAESPILRKMAANGIAPTMDLGERRQAEHKIAESRREARRDYVRYAEEAAKADLEYRKVKATRYVELRAGNETSEGARIRAEADSAEAKCRRDIATSLAKSALLRVEETERDSVVVRDLHAASERVDHLRP